MSGSSPITTIGQLVGAANDAVKGVPLHIILRGEQS
jgi:hypothetical protein